MDRRGAGADGVQAARGKVNAEFGPWRDEPTFTGKAFADRSRLYSPAMARFVALRRDEETLPSLGNGEGRQLMLRGSDYLTEGDEASPSSVYGMPYDMPTCVVFVDRGRWQQINTFSSPGV
jgi:hypothetical protein